MAKSKRAGCRNQVWQIGQRILRQLQVRERFPLSDVQSLQVSPAGAEIEVALLPGPVLIVEIDAARTTARSNLRDIPIRGSRLLVARNLPRCVFNPILAFS